MNRKIFFHEKIGDYCHSLINSIKVFGRCFGNPCSNDTVSISHPNALPNGLLNDIIITIWRTQMFIQFSHVLGEQILSLFKVTINHCLLGLVTHNISLTNSFESLKGNFQFSLVRSWNHSCFIPSTLELLFHIHILALDCLMMYGMEHFLHMQDI